MIENAMPEVAADPAQIAGRWSYRTSSSCEDEDGVGWVEFVWDGAARLYEETGELRWQYVTFSVTWWGTAALEPGARVVANKVENNLGWLLTGGWVRESATRMSIDWVQENKCRGHGEATRAR